MKNKICKSLVTVFVLILQFGLLLSAINFETTVFAVNYKAKVAETEKQAQELAKEVADINENIHNLRKRSDNLQTEIAKIKEESQNYTNIANQAKDLTKQYELQKVDLEAEIVKLEQDTRVIYKELQKQNLTSPVQSIFTATNLGDVISKIYANSTLEQKAQQITLEIQSTIAEKEIAIENQKQTIDRAEAADTQAKEKLAEVQKLLEDTNGDEAKYKEIANQRNAEIEEANKLREKYAAEEKAEQDRIRAELAAKEQLAQQQQAKSKFNSAFNFNLGSNLGNSAKSNTNFNAENYDGKCRFEERSPLGVGKDYFVQPTVGNFEREFGFCDHDGIDISNSTGTPIKAAAAGYVVRSIYTSDGYGNNVILKHEINGRTIYTLYGHMSTMGVSAGETVVAGQQLGKMGSTGNSTGPHLHFMIISGDNYGGPSCRWGSSRCYKPRDYINF